jgi:hypothetical protein
MSVSLTLYELMRAAFSITFRLVALSAVYFICFAGISAALLSTPSQQPAEAQGNAALGALLAISVLNSSVLAYLILRSRWTGWKLILTIFLVFYGATTVMPQIETAFFVTRLPPGMLPRLFLAGAIISLIVSPLAVLILGKRKSPDQQAEVSARLNMSIGKWIGKLTLVVIAYVLIYFSFGYFIAWKSPAVRAYYGGSDPGSFVAQMLSVVREIPLLIPLQVIRALLWAAIAVPVIRMMKGRWWEAGLAVALLFAVVNSQLLLPNPLMPREVRMVHLVETASSNFLFGWITVLVLHGWGNANNAK